ncbi:MAG: hypothetical protein IKV00_01085, partial [Clostridia bacterium]|nr:hypothetical protein [Clostridia bacterium]
RGDHWSSVRWILAVCSGRSMIAPTVFVRIPNRPTNQNLKAPDKKTKDNSTSKKANCPDGRLMSLHTPPPYSANSVSHVEVVLLLYTPPAALSREIEKSAVKQKGGDPPFWYKAFAQTP